MRIGTQLDIVLLFCYGTWPIWVSWSTTRSKQCTAWNLQGIPARPCDTTASKPANGDRHRGSASTRAFSANSVRAHPWPLQHSAGGGHCTREQGLHSSTKHGATLTHGCISNLSTNSPKRAGNFPSRWTTVDNSSTQVARVRPRHLLGCSPSNTLALDRHLHLSDW